MTVTGAIMLVYGIMVFFMTAFLVFLYCATKEDQHDNIGSSEYTETETRN